MINITNVKRDASKALKGKSVSIGIRLTPAVSEYLRANDVSPTALFNAAVLEIGFKPKE